MLKKMLPLLGMMLLIAMPVMADDDKEDPKGPQLTFEKSRHDYGTMYVDSMPDTKIDIKFSNTGDAPIIINQVRACCGTRVTGWPDEPIMPGEQGVVSIEFRLAPRPQRISRTVTVNYNNTERPTLVYRIVGEIISRDL